MAVYRVPDTADELARCLERAQAKGERVLLVQPWANEFIVVTEPTRRRATATRNKRETR